ncbi:hypothetical protein NL676_004892 [Syzygium grande]|nr:hypothetical protein NL676_004892 [Syzygium grande]
MRRTDEWRTATWPAAGNGRHRAHGPRPEIARSTPPGPDDALPGFSLSRSSLCPARPEPDEPRSPPGGSWSAGPTPCYRSF